MSHKHVSQFGFALLGVLLFGLSLFVIGHELRQYDYRDILQSLSTIPVPYLLLAIGLTLLNYFMLTGYDVLALLYIRRSLPYRRTAIAAIASYAISNSIGFALLTGGAIRYRFYSAWGLSAIDVANVVAFSNLGYWLGLFAVGGVVFLIEPIAIPQLLHLPFESVHSISIIFLITVISYLLWSALGKRSLKLGKWVLPHLPVHLSIAQILITSFDWALAGGVLYSLLPTHPMSFTAFFGIYLLAQIVGLVSHVPGGLGVIETVLLLFLSPAIASDDLLGAMLAYRGIYYFLPLVVALLILGSYEVKQRLPKPQS
jgi:glycosyltransferase 2 family protein